MGIIPAGTCGRSALESACRLADPRLDVETRWRHQARPTQRTRRRHTAAPPRRSRRGGIAAGPRRPRRWRSARRHALPSRAVPLRSARRASSVLGAERRAQSAERRARGGDQARRRRPGAQRPRHRRSYYNRLHIAVSLEQHITVKLEQYKLGGYCLLAPLKKKGSPALWPGPLLPYLSMKSS